MPAIVNVTREAKRVRAVVFASASAKHLRVADLLALAHALEGPEGSEIPADTKLMIRKDLHTGEYVEISAECEIISNDVL